MTVLQYIRNTTSRYKTFVANRLAVIQELTSITDWRHIEGRLNPADLASRGFMPSDNGLMQDWLEGPSFLRTDRYPEESTTEQAIEDDSETVMVTQAADNNSLDDAIKKLRYVDQTETSDNEMYSIYQAMSQTSD